MTEKKVITHKEDGIGTIRLNRPESLNALDIETMQLLGRAIQEFSSDDEVRVVVLTGTGRAFSAGGDVKSVLSGLGSSNAEQEESGSVTLYRILGGLRNMPKPVIAALNGLTIGAALYIALGCDIVVASEDAYFQNAFIKYGLHPDFAGTYFLPRVVGTAKACELMFTAEKFDAQEALRLGLVNRVVSQEELYPTVQEICEKIKKFYPPTVTAIKKSIHKNPALSLKEAIEAELEAQKSVIESDPEGFKEYLSRGMSQFNKKAQ